MKSLLFAFILFMTTYLTGCTPQKEVLSNDLPISVDLQSVTEKFENDLMKLQVRGSLINSPALSISKIRFFSKNTCASSPLGEGSYSDLQSQGLTITLDELKAMTIYAMVDIDDRCFFFFQYDPLKTPPDAPIYMGISPASPSRTVTEPTLTGEAPLVTTRIRFYSNATCTTEIGSGLRNDFQSNGITVSVPANTVTSIYAKTFEPFGNSSACTLMTTYTHWNLGPNPPIYLGTNPISPSRTTASPLIRGSVASNVASIEFFNDAACTQQIGSGTKSEFESSGVTVSASDNLSTLIYARALDTQSNPSSCQFMTTFINDTIPPSNPTYASMSPSSPTRLTLLPKVTGTASADTQTIKFYSDRNCLVQIGSGTRSAFQGSGITVGIRANAITSIYAQAYDLSGNFSSCVYFTDYQHSTIKPDAPVYTTTTPLSPTNLSITPKIFGGASSNAPLPTEKIYFFSNDTCSTGIGSGTASDFESVGITLNANDNATTQIYAQAEDLIGNRSDCVILTNYMHSTQIPPAPTFTVTNPTSPSRTSNTPFVFGTATSVVRDIRMYSDMGCSTLIGTGTRIGFQNGGIRVTLPQNTISKIYAQAMDIYGNESVCTEFTTYTHTTITPSAPSFTSFTPNSPTNQTFSPTVRGLSPNNVNAIIPTFQVGIFDSSSCVNRVGIDTVANFQGSGIAVNLGRNTVTQVYARAFDQAGNGSACTYLADYTHSDLQPARPTYSQASPASPSFNPEVNFKGGFLNSPDFLARHQVSLFSDPVCSTLLGSVSASLYSTVGVDVTVPINQTTAIYGQTTNIVGTKSSCQYLTNYTHSYVAPQNLTATARPNGAIQLSWLPDLIANPPPTYTIRRSNKTGGPYSVIASGIRGTSYTDNAVNNNTEYFYVIFSTNDTGRSLDSAQVTATTNANPIVAPTSLTAVPGPGRVDLSWNADASSMTFEIYRSLTSRGNFSLIASGITTSQYSDTTAVNDSTYYYVVRAVNPIGKSNPSNEASATPKSTPPAPLNFKATFLEDPNCDLGFTAQFTWDPSPYYETFRITSNGPVPSPTINNNVTYCSWTNVSQSVFSYNVVGTWGGVDGPPSSSQVLIGYDVTPARIYPGNNQIFITYAPPPLYQGEDPTHYQIERSTRSRGPYTVIASATSNSYLDTTVSNGTTYYYRVTPVNSGNLHWNYMPTKELIATPGSSPGSPTNLKVFSNASRQPVLEWSAPNTFAGFNVYRSSNSGGPWTLYATLNDPAINTYTDITPMLGANHYRVTTVWGQSQESAPSSSVVYRNGFPGSLTLTAGTSAIAASWTSVTGASSYTLRRGIVSGGPYSDVTTTASLSFNDTTVTQGVGYYYVIAANFSDGTTGQNSIERSSMTTNNTIPSGVYVSDTTSGSISVSWARVQSATSYRLYRATAMAGPYAVVATTPNGTTTTATASTLNPNTQYFFRVTAMSGGESAQSSTVTGFTSSPPNAPTVTAGNASVTINWAPVSGVQTYSLQRSTDRSTFSTIVSGLSNGTTIYQDTTVTNGQMYYYRVAANMPGSTTTSGPSNGVTPGITPPNPSGVQIIANDTGTSLDLIWGPVNGATGYRVYTSSSSGGPYNLAGNSSSNSGFSLSSLTSDVPVYIVVTALNGDLESGYSPEASAIPMITPIAPTSVVTAANEITTSWTAISGATGYRVERTTNRRDYEVLAANQAGTSYVDTTPADSTPYWYRYRPLFSGIEGAASANGNSASTVSKPLTPQNLIMNVGIGPVINLQWTGVTNISRYDVYRASTASGPFTSLVGSTTSATQLQDNTVSVGNSYFYVVKSVNSSGVPSDESNVVGVNLLLSPSGLTATASQGKTDLSWNAVAGATQYEIARSTASGGPYDILTSTNTLTTFSDANAADGVTYFYVVRAIFASGAKSGDSNEASATGILKINLEHPIELMDLGLMSTSASTTFERTRTSFRTSDYDGTVTYRFELVAINNESSAVSIDLVDQNNNTISSISIPGSSPLPTRYSQAFTLTNGDYEFRVRLPGTSPGSVQVNSGKIWVRQQGASRTRLYIPLLSGPINPSNSDAEGFVESITQTSYTDLAGSHRFLKESQKYMEIEPTNGWALETLTSTTGLVRGSVALIHQPTQQVVLGSEGVISNTSIQSSFAVFSEDSSSFSSQTNGHEYRVSARCEFKCDTGVMRLYKAGLWVKLRNLQNGQVHVRLAHRVSFSMSDTFVTTHRIALPLASFGQTNIFFQSVFTGTLDAAGSVSLYDLETQDSDTTNATFVTGSSLTPNGTAKTRLRTATSLTLTDGDRYVPQHTLLSGSFDVVTSSLIIEFSR